MAIGSEVNFPEASLTCLKLEDGLSSAPFALDFKIAVVSEIKKTIGTTKH